MIRSLSLNNFKSFSEFDSLEIKPLTILCGVNSGGKSSIIKSLLMMKQTAESNVSGNSILLNGPLSINGTMNDVLHQHKGTDFAVSNRFAIRNGAKQTVRDAKQDLTPSKELQKLFSINATGRFEIEVEYIIGKRGENNNCIKGLSVHMMHKTGTSEERLADFSFKYIQSRYNIHIEYLKVRPELDADIENVDLLECTCYFQGIRLNNLYCNRLTERVEFNVVFPKLCSILRICADQYSGIRYVGPLRDFPERGYAISASTINNIHNGMVDPMALAEFQKKKAKEKLFPPMTDLNFHLLPTLIGMPNQVVIDAWMNYLGLPGVTVSGTDSMYSIKIGEDNIADVGFGVSQVLPILTESLMMEREQTLILEQPEIHLHPRMQMNLTDLFLRLSENNRNVIIETHSDHIINRIVRRVLECNDPLFTNNVAIYFFDKDEEGSHVVPITIDPVKGIAQCPDAFFTQFAAETRYIFQAGMNNIRRE